MHSLATVLLSASLAAAFPSGIDLLARGAAPSADTCTIAYTPPSSGGVACGYQSRLTNVHGVIGNVITDGSFNACQTECLRNSDCKASTWKQDGTCTLYTASLNDLGFTIDSTSSLYNSDRACWTLKGLCLPHEGSFESRGSPDPLYDGLMHPWSQDGVNSYFVLNQNQLHGPVPNTTAGTQFVKALVNDDTGRVEMRQEVNLAPSTSYRLDVNYNFIRYTHAQGNGDPQSVRFYVHFNDAFVLDMDFPFNSYDDKWYTKSLVFKTTPNGSQTMYVGVNTYTKVLLPGSKFDFLFGIDALKITPV